MSERLVIKVRCHVCWRDPNCECDGKCDYEAITKHECDCDYCTYEPEAEGDCTCICHTSVVWPCKRCNGTHFIEYEAIGGP